MNRLNGKVALVTGASKGFGAAIARLFAAEGASVAVNYSSSKIDAERVVAEIAAAGGQAIAVKANVAKHGDVKQLIAETIAAFGKLDVVVNNAGVYEFVSVEEITEAHFHKLFDLNVLGTILVTQAALPHLGPGSSVINMSSIVSVSPSINGPVYSATKGAVDAFTKSASKAYGPKQIRFNTLNPGLVETEGLRGTGETGENMKKRVLSVTPLGRLGSPEDIANAALFFASDESSFITGEGIVIAGGLR